MLRPLRRSSSNLSPAKLRRGGDVATVRIVGLGGAELAVGAVDVPAPPSAALVRGAVAAALRLPLASFELVVRGHTAETDEGAELLREGGHPVTVVPTAKAGLRGFVPALAAPSSAAAIDLGSAAALDRLESVVAALPADDGTKLMVAVPGADGAPGRTIELTPADALALLGRLQAAATTGSALPGAGPAAGPGAELAAGSAGSAGRRAAMQQAHDRFVDEAKDVSRRKAENVRMVRKIDALKARRAAKAARRARLERAHAAATARGEAASDADQFTAAPSSSPGFAGLKRGFLM